MSARVEIRGAWKSFGKSPALSDVTLDLAAGTTTTVVGPSGSGKTTLLRCLAGLLAPDAGTILFDGRDMTGVAAERRGVGLVFQSYALFPHLTVAENIGFGLLVRGTNRADRERRVREVAESLQLTALLERRPAQISGGERQRVALGRALAYRPVLLLLDEPLAALDPNLAASVREELANAIARERTTVLFVTHDRSDALRLGDRVVVLRAGRVEQVGTPREIYGAPVNSYVARFFGPAATWLLQAVRNGAGVVAETPLGRVPLPGASEGPVRVVVRPEAVRPASTGEGVRVRVLSAVYEGDRYRVFVEVGSDAVPIEWPPDLAVAAGDWISVRLEPSLLVTLSESV